MSDPMMGLLADSVLELTQMVEDLGKLTAALEDRIAELESRQHYHEPIDPLRNSFEPATSYQRAAPYAGNWGS